MMKNLSLLLLLLTLLALTFSGCSPRFSEEVSRQVEQLFPSITLPTRTPFLPVRPTPTRTPTSTPTPEPVTTLRIWIEPALPDPLRQGLNLPKGAQAAESAQQANIIIGPLRGGTIRVDWIYALAAPFPTITDSVPQEELLRAWRGEPGAVLNGRLLMDEPTRNAFAARWGEPKEARLAVLPAAELLSTAWANRVDWAIMPFETVEPRWKVIRVDGISPFDRTFSAQAYPLAVWFGITGSPDAMRLMESAMRQPEANAGGMAGLFPPTNRDPNKMTHLVMTGVTALARATAYKMDTLGVTYPGKDIAEWLRDADIAHISNEVSFNPNCPKANFADTATTFCSQPEYIQLLDFIGADVIELSGNHNNDFGREASRFSLDLYRQRNWAIFAGGENLEAARQPARITHNGNRLAFIGCNLPGPPGAWATAAQPGAAPCDDMQWMFETINALRQEGYLPVVTFQYLESYTFLPSGAQRRDFRAAIDAGAIIVSGSQAHFPQIVELYEGANGPALIHYGLGNLFFDQMDEPVEGTRRELIDRHIFYNGRHVQTELLTALLEDYARPRPMEPAEREAFLADLFAAGGW